MSLPLSEQTIAVIGAGNLGTALIKGLIDSGVPQSSIFIRSSNDESSAARAEQLGVMPGESNLAIAQTANLVILAVKPQKMPAVFDDLATLQNTQQLFISVAAGISCHQFESSIGAAHSSPAPIRVIRAMPNTPALVKKGATGICRGTHAGAQDMTIAQDLFQKLGLVVEVDESQINLVTGLSGSGPAYVMRLVEAMTQSAEELGLETNVALALVTQTIEGAIALLQASDDTPAELRAKVTSPGGTTMAGLAAMDKYGFDKAVNQAVKAAKDRADELGAPQD